MIITGTRQDHWVTDTVLVVTAVVAVVILLRTSRQVTSEDGAIRVTIIPAIGGPTPFRYFSDRTKCFYYTC